MFISANFDFYQAGPNWKWFAALCQQELGARYFREYAKVKGKLFDWLLLKWLHDLGKPTGLLVIACSSQP